MAIKLPEYMRSYPDDSLLFPRDENIVTRSNDYLFIARLVRAFTEDMKWLNSYKDINNKTFYLLESRTGSFHLPLCGEYHDKPEYAVQSRMKMATVRKHLFDSYYDVRKFIITVAENKFKTDQRLSIQGLIVIDEGVVDNDALEKLNDMLRWRLDNDNSSVSWARRLYDGNIYTNEEFDVICPVDGPLNTIRATLSSPQWTWSALCGREYEMALCPQCLGRFATRLVKMS